MSELREKLADLAHKQWSGWMSYLLKCIDSPDRDEHIERWRNQVVTDYWDLPDRSQDSDRKEADKVMALLKSHRDMNTPYWNDLYGRGR